MDYNNRHLYEMLESLYEFSEENIQLDHATLVDQFVANNLSKFATKERGIVLIENLRSRFLNGGQGLDGTRDTTLVPVADEHPRNGPFQSAYPRVPIYHHHLRLSDPLFRYAIIMSSPINSSKIATTISCKLTRTNFLLWKAQVVPILRGVQLYGYLDGTTPMPAAKMITRAAAEAREVDNLQHAAWVVQD
nr:hypothetical protein [Tanacetum cinerariifolium]